MRYYIQEGNAEAILSLYDKFMALVGDKNLKAELELESAGSMEGEGQEEKGAEETKNSLATDTELKSERFPAVPAGRVHVLMAVVTAHAMKDSFKDALDACTRTVVQLSETLGVSFIQQTFKHNLALRDKVKSYFTRLFAAGLISHPASFVHYVTRLGTRKSADSLEKFYHVISTGLSGEDAFLVADPSLVTETRTIALTPMCWTALLSAFLKCNRKNSAAQLWDDMTSAGAPPGISMWTALLDSYGEIRAADDAIATWEMMIQQGVKPDTLAYRAIISALFKGRRPVDAMRMFEEYKKLPVVEGPHRLSLYNTILHGLCLTPERAEEAEKIRKAMEKEGPRPDMVTYNTFINYYGRRQQFQGVAATVRAMQEFGFEGDVFTYTTILSALLKVGKTDAAELVLALMDKQGVKKNVALYSSLIEHQFRAGTEQNFRAAMLMLAKMEKDPENQPNEITYTSVLCGLYRLGWMDPEDLQRIEANIIQRIRQRNVSLGLPAYHLLLKTCLVYPHENGVQQAMAYYEEMKKREIPIINTTWYILLAGLLNKGEWTLADKMVGEMYASGIHPTNSLLRLVHQINSRASGRGRM
ncbi:hypothetical protein AN958_06093 [Leucoagaricus sp. SymC.cos]|nr:hypothetical protein AN958_06093 [Leucoagaricus sp. SymC.cos]